VVAEDDQFFRVILAKRLEVAGHQVVLTEDGEQAWEAVQADPPELLISDWMMPRLDGHELCRRVKQDPDLRETYCILLTAKDRMEDKVAALDFGADDYLVKPCDDTELLARVRTGLRVYRLCAKLKRVSVTDWLTGLSNRRYFDQRLAEEVARSRRHFTPLSLVLIDLDGFKAINDRFGHPAGDAVLASAGGALRGRARAGDVVARIGGDEFAAILHNTTLEGALSFARSVEELLTRIDLPPELRLLGSFGGSAGCAELAEGLDCGSLIAAADRDLYARKRARRSERSRA